MKKLEGEVAIVTGSGRSIGQAIALKLAGEGAKVMVNDLDAGPAEETIAKIRALGNDAKRRRGEAPAICVAAATANAIYNATGVRICGLPFTPERVYRALHGKGEKLYLAKPAKAA